MFDFEQVIRIERGGEPLVALVVRDGIEPVGRQVFGKILDMDDLAHQEKVLPLRANDAAEKLEEPFGQKIGNIQPQTVDLKFIDPELDCAADVIGHRAAVQIELDKLHVPFPALVPKSVVVAGIAAEIDVEPILFVAPLAAGAHVLKGEKTAADMVEHAVEHDADARFVKFFDQTLKIGVVAEPPVHIEEIDRVVPVPLAFKQRVEQNGGKSHFLDVRDLFFDELQAAAHLSEVVFPFRAAIAERIDLIKSTLVKPHIFIPAQYTNMPQQNSCGFIIISHRKECVNRQKKKRPKRRSRKRTGTVPQKSK